VFPERLRTMPWNACARSTGTAARDALERLRAINRNTHDQGVALDRGTMSRYVEQAGNTFGATVVNAMWADAIASAQVISTDATGALIQPAKGAKDGRAQACKKGHFFTAVVDCDAVLFAYVEHHTAKA
jgi:transposase